MSECCTPAGVLDPPQNETPKAAGEVRTIALIGPPNSGKSTLFNRLTGLRQKVANYPGVTVEQHMGRMAGIGRSDLTLIDLPGIYSLDAFSEDARVSVEVLRGEMPGTPKPDAVLLVLDSLHLTRQLMLAAPVLSLGLPTMVLLNMSDLMDARGGVVDPLLLAQELGAPVALVSAAKGTGLESVQLFLNRLSGKNEQPKLLLPVLGNAQSTHRWAAQVSSRTGYRAPLSAKATQRVDRILLHPVLGPLLFLVIVFGVFQVVFSVGLPLSNAMQESLAEFGRWATSYLPAGWLRSLALDGAWNGVTAVLVFLPQILLLFLFIGILEDTGYLARAALIADRVMRSIGLNGKAFIPLLSAYACAVPAIMATRTIENKRDRIATILIAPFMTCSARLPVYILIIAAFIPDRNLFGRFFGVQAAAMLGLYILGFVAAMLTARLLKSTILKSKRSSFMLEMPPYRWPTARSLALRLVDRSKVFLYRAGTVILTVAIVIWVLSNLPLNHGKPPAIEHSITAGIGHLVEPAIKPLGFNWKIGIGLITSLAARETMVSSLGTIYGIDEGDEHSAGLQHALHQDMTLGGAVGLLVFFAFAMQCMSTTAVVRRETGGWFWPAVQFAYMTGLAYVCAFLANRIVSIWA